MACMLFMLLALVIVVFLLYDTGKPFCLQRFEDGSLLVQCGWDR